MSWKCHIGNNDLDVNYKTIHKTIMTILKHSQHKSVLFQLLELSASRGFKGLDGIFRFLPEGYVERGLSIFQVGERNNKIISRSPQKFMNPSD